jgi:predicted nucleotide-binding protein (sugar kinase/HSP70/actin superfamily)
MYCFLYFIILLPELSKEKLRMEISGKLKSKISELTVEELKALITESVKEAVEEALENFEAISSNSYLNSVKESREEYKKGDFQKLGDVL